MGANRIVCARTASIVANTFPGGEPPQLLALDRRNDNMLLVEIKSVAVVVVMVEEGE